MVGDGLSETPVQHLLGSLVFGVVQGVQRCQANLYETLSVRRTFQAQI